MFNSLASNFAKDSKCKLTVVFLSLLLSCGDKPQKEKEEETIAESDASSPFKTSEQPTNADSFPSGPVVVSSPYKVVPKKNSTTSSPEKQNEVVFGFTIDGLLSDTLHTNGNQIAIKGNCEDFSELVIKTQMDQPMIAKSSCTDGQYELFYNKEQEGLTKIFAYSVSEGKTSATKEFFVNFDSLSPAEVVLTSPLQNPFLSSVNAVNLQGNCESGTKIIVNTTGTSFETACIDSGIFSVDLMANEFGSFSFEILQEDLAGNRSSAFVFTWHYSDEIPSSPILTNPVATEILSNARKLSLTGKCLPLHLVTLSGNIQASEVQPGLIIECKAHGDFNFDISKSSDGHHILQLAQQNPASQMNSSLVIIQWHIDTEAPEKPTLLAPNSNPYVSSEQNLTVRGSCETSSQVILEVSPSKSMTCADGSFQFQVSEAIDGNYVYSIKQIDIAGNPSESLLLEWTKDTAVPNPPSILQPSSNPFINSSDSLSISGSCTRDYTVALTGQAENEDSTEPTMVSSILCENGTYAFAVENPTPMQDRTFEFQLIQTSQTNIKSSPANFTWVIDRETPTVDITSSPSNPSHSKTAIFGFQISEAAQTECQIDGGVWNVCQSPVTYDNLSFGNHEFAVKATDLAGNVSTISTFTWKQNAFETALLFHFNSAEPGPLSDSSPFDTKPVTDSGSQLVSSGLFSQAIQFPQANNNLSLGNQAYFDQLMTQMTLEAWIRPQELERGEKQIILTKGGPQGFSFEWFVHQLDMKQDRMQIGFSASVDGSQVVTILSNKTPYNNKNWYHFAVTWNAGQVMIFMNGVMQGSGTVGTLGQASLFASNEALMIGNNPAGTSPLKSFLDELRVSSSIRYNANFKVPSAEFAVD